MREISTRRWSGPAEAPDTLKLLRTQGYRDAARIRPRVRAAAESAIHEAVELATPQATYVVRALEAITDTGAVLEDGATLACRAFSEHLKGADGILIFVITLGQALDEAITEGFKEASDPLRPLFLDNAGWLMIEAATRDFSRALKAELASQNQRLTKRMAPGYSYPSKGSDARDEWPLTDQKILFDQFNGVDVHVELLESGAMLPRMSRSGIFGILTQTGDTD